LPSKSASHWSDQGGKFRDFFPEHWVIDHLKMAKTPHPTPHPHEKLFQHNLIIFGYIDQRVLIMTQTSETVTYSLESVLTRIESKIDNLQRDVNQKIDSLQRDMDQKFDNLQRDMDQKFDSLQRDVDQKIDSLQKDVNQKFDSLQKDVNQKFDSLQKDVNDLKVEVTEIKGDIKTLDQKVEAMDKRLEKVEDSYAILVKDIADLKGFKSLIIPMVVAFLSAVVTLGLRGFFLGNQP